MNEIKKIPIMEVGRYAGAPVDQLPNSYLRWIITQKGFPKEIVECAHMKLIESNYSDLFLNVSRHAIDMFSKRFLSKWISSEQHKGDEGDGLATYITEIAQEAWEIGQDVSKHRHQDDGTMKLCNDIIWVFQVNPNFPDYKTVITVMPSEKER